jgi:hypothetical protein
MRLLIHTQIFIFRLAQALSEPLRLLTADRMLSQYSDLVITTQRRRTS